MTSQPVASRRGFLGHLAGAATFAAATTTPSALSAEERLAQAIEELKAAAKVCYPQIADWNVAVGASNKCPLVVAAYDWTSNDGWVKPADREGRR